MVFLNDINVFWENFPVYPVLFFYLFFIFYEQSTLEKKAERERCMKNRLRLGQFVPVR